jgi:ABC-type phosphate transport system substrate-binding protein
MPKRSAWTFMLVLAAVLIVSACGGSTNSGTQPAVSTTPSGSAASSAGASTDASNGAAASLIGAGSNFVNPFFSQAFTQYRRFRCQRRADEQG